MKIYKFTGKLIFINLNEIVGDRKGNIAEVEPRIIDYWEKRYYLMAKA